MSDLDKCFEAGLLDDVLIRATSGNLCSVYFASIGKAKTQPKNYLRQLKKTNVASARKMAQRLNAISNRVITNKHHFEEYTGNLKGVCAVKIDGHRMYGTRFGLDIVFFQGQKKDPNWPTKGQRTVILSQRRDLLATLERVVNSPRGLR